MKIADILGLRQREELRPRQRQRILDDPADLELPRLDGDVRVLAEIHHGPVPHFVLSDRQARHAVPVRLTGPAGLRPANSTLTAPLSSAICRSMYL
jgi:hypothetical protein